MGVSKGVFNPMATAYGRLTFQVRDGNDAVASTSYNVKADTTGTLQDMLDDALGSAALMDVIIGGKIEKVSVSIDHPDLSSLKPNADAGSDITQTGTFNFSQSGNPYREGVVLPSIRETVVIGGKINLTDADVTSWIEAMESAGLILQAVGKALAVLVNIIDALFSFRKRSKAVNRRTFP